jgi:hypothetical protein
MSLKFEVSTVGGRKDVKVSITGGLTDVPEI